MIPLRLEMRDFLSYASPDAIDFTRFDVACLSGDNGAGKTAILDAITYALFGAARGCENGQNQERLVREGADEATVTLTFELNAQTYRIIRKRRRPKAGERTAKGNEVRFEALTAEGWTNIAKNSIRETDRHIEHVLRMDYRTFVNSAFFLQGRADEFLAAMTPDERKEVFAKLLDLGTYELLESAARERSRASERSRQELAAQAERLAASAPDPDAIQGELDAATAAAEQAGADLLDAEQAASEARDRLASLEREAAVLDSQRQALAELERSRDEAAAAVAVRTAELEEIDALLARSDEVSQALDEIERLRDADAKARDDAARAATLREQLSTLEERVRNERAAIERRIAERKKAGATLATERKTLSTAQADLEAALQALADSAGVDAELVEVTKQIDDERSHESSARERVAACDAKLTEIEEKLDLLNSDDAACPLCGGPLDPAHRRDITRSLNASTKQLASERKAADAQREAGAKEVRRLSEEATRLTKVQRDRSKVEGAVDGLRARCERLAAVVSEIERLTAEHKTDETALADESYAAEWRPQIEETAAALAGLYDAEAHEAVTRRLADLRIFEQLHGRITAAAERRPSIVEDRSRAEAREAEAAIAVSERHKAIAEIEGRVGDLAAVRAESAHLDDALSLRRREATAADPAVARLGERLEGARRAASDIAASRAAEAEAAAVHRRYDMLVKAFGRGGIPDRIIGNALPELREDANAILGQLSDFDMYVDFRLDRETKSGKVRETFDVLVSHDGGVRDFRMFSGGEAFRIAFAVRLALSKLLVRRAGARLQTLVVDEGFGTQDPTGRERLIEAIDLARGEFAKVLVITHLDELKDVFGHQIRITKDPMEGSRVDICS